MSHIEAEREYWANRARSYPKLEWASRSDYLEKVVRSGDLTPTDVVLDAGTGTGLVATAVAAYVAKVIGVDISPEMMARIKPSFPSNCEFETGDIRKLHFPSGCFSKVFARMVLHGLVNSAEEALRECYRVVAPGGKFVLSEGIPPAKAAGDWYTAMFRLKEERLTFFADTLERLVSRAGFSLARTEVHVSPQISVRNWLENSGLPECRKARIMQMHLEMPDMIQEAYGATFTDKGDVLLDMKFAIVVGTKDGVVAQR